MRQLGERFTPILWAAVAALAVLAVLKTFPTDRGAVTTGRYCVPLLTTHASPCSSSLTSEPVGEARLMPLR